MISRTTAQWKKGTSQTWSPLNSLKGRHKAWVLAYFMLQSLSVTGAKFIFGQRRVSLIGADGKQPCGKPPWPWLAVVQPKKYYCATSQNFTGFFCSVWTKDIQLAPFPTHKRGKTRFHKYSNSLLGQWWCAEGEQLQGICKTKMNKKGEKILPVLKNLVSAARSLEWRYLYI